MAGSFQLIADEGKIFFTKYGSAAGIFARHRDLNTCLLIRNAEAGKHSRQFGSAYQTAPAFIYELPDGLIEWDTPTHPAQTDFTVGGKRICYPDTRLFRVSFNWPNQAITLVERFNFVEHDFNKCGYETIWKA